MVLNRRDREKEGGELDDWIKDGEEKGKDGEVIGDSIIATL